MFDLTQMGLPCQVEAYGRKWVALHLVSAKHEKGQMRQFFLATEETAELPAPCSLIEVVSPL